ncbi:MAG: hypothetical protein R3B95_02860 [Nitrospirales bacterium]|nr:hypothetical protein [Nitrospirales bacterium]
MVFLSPLLEYELFAKILHSLDDAEKQKLVDAIGKVDKEKLVNEEDGDSGEGEADERFMSKTKEEKKLSAKHHSNCSQNIKSPEKSFKEKM